MEMELDLIFKPNYTSILLNKIKTLRGLRNPKNGSSDNWTGEGFI
jgi:hypothetical protein